MTKQIDAYSYRKGYMQALNTIIEMYRHYPSGCMIESSAIVSMARRFKEIFDDEGEERCNCPICSIQYNGNSRWGGINNDE